jgi:AcrR family transcriptional regulator
MIDMLPRLENPVDVGETREELLAFVRGVVKQLSSRPFGPAMQALASMIATEPELARTYRERVVEPRRELLKTVIDRGIARGDLREDTDVRFLHEFLVGPLFYRLFFSGGKLDRKLAERLVDDILEGFAPRTARKPRL